MLKLLTHSQACVMVCFIAVANRAGIKLSVPFCCEISSKLLYTSIIPSALPD